MPPGVEMNVAYDESVYVERAINEVWESLAIAFGLVVVVIYVFLHNFRATLIPTVAIPVSIVANFVVMYWLGFSVNILTMLALVLAIGVVVDDAIVVLENIYRHIENGVPPFKAAIIGSGNIVHNLRAMENRGAASEFGFDWAARFDEAAAELLTATPGEALRLREHGDYEKAVPTPDHFIPMLYLAGLGAADDHPPAVLDTMIQGYCYGSLSMTSYTLGLGAAP